MCVRNILNFTPCEPSFHLALYWDCTELDFKVENVKEKLLFVFYLKNQIKSRNFDKKTNKRLKAHEGISTV